jgi:hypothetical protein
VDTWIESEIDPATCQAAVQTSSSAVDTWIESEIDLATCQAAVQTSSSAVDTWIESEIDLATKQAEKHKAAADLATRQDADFAVWHQAGWQARQVAAKQAQERKACIADGASDGVTGQAERDEAAAQLARWEAERRRAAVPIEMVAKVLRAFDERVVDEAHCRAVLRGERRWIELAAATRAAIAEVNCGQVFGLEATSSSGDVLNTEVFKTDVFKTDVFTAEGADALTRPPNILEWQRMRPPVDVRTRGQPDGGEGGRGRARAKAGVEEGERRALVLNSAGLHTTTEDCECVICLRDVFLSAVICNTMPGRLVCPSCAILPEAFPGSRVEDRIFLYRHTITELCQIVLKGCQHMVNVLGDAGVTSNHSNK